MKNRLVYSILIALTVCSCQVVEITEDLSTNGSEPKVFTATIEDSATRTSLDADGNVLWKMGDQVSIFEGSTINEQYQVSDDSDGKTSASLNKISSSGFVAGGEIENNVAFYPYAAATTIVRSGSSYVIKDFTLPATQTYAEGSFGNGAFPMAAVTSSTDDLNLKFKNVLGGLKLQLKGTAKIATINITGRNNEILCGAAEITVTNGSTPSINLTDAAAKTVTLDCGGGVQLNSEIATSFIIALPPITMDSGFTVVVTDTEGKQMEISSTKSQTINRSKLLKMPEVEYEGVITSHPLTFTSTGETSISLVKIGTPDNISLDYKVNDGAWASYTIKEVIALSDGEKVSFRAGSTENTSFCKSFFNYYKFVFGGSGTLAASGNIMSLVAQTDIAAIPSSYYFGRLFSNCTSMTTAPQLPATTLADHCYEYMFSGCSSLTDAPQLPATTLAEWCYEGLFSGCSSLTDAPQLPATILATGCYSHLFSSTNLTAAPVLPATILADQCYASMFSGCTGLTAAPELPATTLADQCYTGMFSRCTGLTAAPELPAITLAYECYNHMFSGCTGLSSAPELPATSLAPGCYFGMFNSCTGLAAAPELPAMGLVSDCYKGMFAGCTSLTTAPVLPATTLARTCYWEMFAGCTNLSYIKMLATDVSATGCLNNWVSSVAPNGRFVKNLAATWDITGDSGIPTGWTVVTE